MSQSEINSLQKKYEKLMKESFNLSKSNRAKADQKYAEAEAVADKIDALKKSI